MPIAPDFVFPARDVDALAEKLAEAVQNHERLEQVKEAALAHIKTWSPERNIEATIQAAEIAVTECAVRGDWEVP